MRAYRAFSPSRLALAGLAASLLASSAAAQGDPCAPPANDTGYAEIKVDVEAGTFDRVLPFDVPLRLCGSAPPEVSEVQVFKASGATSASFPLDSCKDPGARQPDAVGRAAGGTFRVVLDRLDAERSYAFCFRLIKSLTAEQKKAFAAKARTAIDAYLSKVDSAELTVPEAADLRKQLRQLLEDTADADQTVTTGTLFDETKTDREIDARFLGFVNAVLAPQLRRSAVLTGQASPGAPAGDSYATLQMRLRQDLDEIGANPSLGRFVAALDTAAAGNVNLATLLSSEFSDELTVARASDEQASRLARGLPASGDGGDLDLTTATDPAMVGSIADNYRNLSRTLSNPDPKALGLDELIADALSGGMTAAGAAGLSAEDKAALESLSKGAIARAASRAFTLGGQAGRLVRSLGERSQALDRLVAEVEAAAATVSVADGTTTGNFDTSQRNYISADAGLVYAIELDEVVPYGGTNIYFRPVNKNAPLRTLGNFRQTFSRRFALTIGLTMSSIADDQQVERKDLFASQALMLGAGLRITDSLRLSAGAFVFREDDPSPLVSDFSVAATYYLSISFDMDVLKFFNSNFGNLYK